MQNHRYGTQCAVTPDVFKPDTFKQGAFTLIELMITVSIVSILLVIGLPAMLDLIERNRANAAISEIYRLIHLGRETAVRHNTIITICQSSDKSSCTNSSETPLLIFSDGNENRAVDEADNEQVYYQQGSLPTGSRLKWSFFGNRRYLEMTPEGWTNHQNGTLIYCPASGEAKYARALIIHKSGRMRFAIDTNGDDIVNLNNGSNVSC